MNTLCTLSKTWAPLLGRMLMAVIFLQSGVDKIVNFSKTAGFMASKGMPMAEALLVPAILLLIGGALMLLAGWQARWGALALVVFLVPATLIFHPFWAAPEAQQMNQFHHFFKNLAILGGLFVIIGMGSGPLSLRPDPGDGQNKH